VVDPGPSPTPGAGEQETDGAAAPGSSGLEDVLVARVARHGPVTFAEVMELALYDPVAGFYAATGHAGRRGGDFLTSPEVGPLFGAVLARALDAWWRELGEPEPFVVVECGAGPGTLARTVLAADAACANALTWVLVERSERQRRRHGEILPLVEPAMALSVAAEGPRFVSLPTLPALRVRGVVLANELLDNLPVRLLEWRDDAWCEVRVGLGTPSGGPPGAGAHLAEYLVPAEQSHAELATRLVPAPSPGARVPVQQVAGDWARAARDLLDAGRLVVVDYGDSTAALAARPVEEWLRTYRSHDRGTSPLADLGRQDITCEVAIDQLELVLGTATACSQAEFLRRWGIEELVAEGRRVWHERAHLGDLRAMTARSRVREAETLLDPAGLGAFRVLEWPVGERTEPGLPTHR
jgi:SAM-dependent MidA family methyltransferase